MRNIDCSQCIYGTSTGHGICADCDGSLFIHKEEYIFEEEIDDALRKGSRRSSKVLK